MTDLIQVRRDTAADWTSNDPTLAAGEMGFESDTNKLKIGDGSTAWTALAYLSEPTGRVLKDEVSRITNPGATSFNFTGLTLTTYDRVILVAEVRSVNAAASDNLSLYLNGDTTDANYHNQVMRVYNATEDNAEGNTPFVGTIPGNTSPAGSYGLVTITIENPGSSNLKMASVSVNCYYDTDAGYVHEGTITSDETAAVTSIQLISAAPANLTGRAILYGERTI